MAIKDPVLETRPEAREFLDANRKWRRWWAQRVEAVRALADVGPQPARRLLEAYWEREVVPCLSERHEEVPPSQHRGWNQSVSALREVHNTVRDHLNERERAAVASQSPVPTSEGEVAR